MRLFGGERITSLMQKLGAADEVLEHPMLNKSVERAQKKVEENNFAIRKRLLEFDNVMNQQREVIYDRRRHALHGERLKSEVFDYVDEFVNDVVAKYYPDNLALMLNDIRTKLLIDIVVDDARAAELGVEGLKEKTIEAARDFYQRKEAQFGSEFMANLERFAVLHVIDERWRQHLRDMDDLREGIYLRSYAQRDPVVEYKREAFAMFSAMLTEIDVEVMSFTFKYFPEMRAQQQGAQQRARAAETGLPRERTANTSTTRRLRFSHATTAGMGLAADAEAQALASAAGESATPDGAETAPRTITRDQPKIGRNDPCYCGSGKKFKHCHGR